MDTIVLIGIISAVLFGCFFGVSVLVSRKTGARQKSLDKQAARDEIIAARKRMSIKTGDSSGNDNPILQTAKRDIWFTVFLYLVIGLNLFFIINNIVVIMKNGDTGELNALAIGFMTIKIVLYIIEIFLYILIFVKMKKKIVIVYIIFLVISAMLNFFTFDAIPLIFKYVPVYFVFKSQWHNFE
jgi:Na+-driven multidrug efflux pump